MSKNTVNNYIRSTRPLRLLDIIHWALQRKLEKLNRAVVLSNMLQDTSPTLSMPTAARSIVHPQKKRFCSYVQIQNSEVKKLLHAQWRSGPWSWEISQLFLDVDDEADDTELLDKVCHRIAQHGGQRIFVRLRANDPLTSSWLLSGFTVIARETLYIGPKSGVTGDNSTLIRNFTDTDSYSIFQLYNRVTPAKVRLATGMTFEQWRSSKELSSGFTQEFVCHKQDELIGWIRINLVSNTSLINVMVHPHNKENTEEIIATAMEQTTGTRYVHFLATEYDRHIHDVLVQKRFEPVCDYKVLARATTVLQQDVGRPIAVAPI